MLRVDSWPLSWGKLLVAIVAGTVTTRLPCESGFCIWRYFMSEMERWYGTLEKIAMPEKYKTWSEQVGFLLNEGYYFEDLSRRL